MSLAARARTAVPTDTGRGAGADGHTGFAARAAVRAERGPGGRTRITRLRSDGPLALRESGDSVYLVGAGAGPLGGDDLELTIEVGPGARLDLRSAAAALVLPGRRDAGTSRLIVRADVAAGGRLVFAPEPTIAAAGCDHHALAEVTLDEGAELVWREEIVLGRHDEPPGRYVSRFDVTAGTVPLLRHELRIDEDATSGAVLGDAGAVGTLLITGVTAEPYADEGLAVLPLAGPGVLVTAMAADTVRLRERLERGRRLFT
ncbi:urease accessory protein UreD [Actinoallomurus purpureus]|uniref:urease accessory protein UreD n=1 Tax=Actinoallomurus purpureus TaxID=478114 RepID=UPI0020920C70|nr:urease accessory protein UreD [Actinoallomurus purpureus]MCO6008050.1 urease accessory protein UreD [Actinoallomurus purpureus]